MEFKEGETAQKKVVPKSEITDTDFVIPTGKDLIAFVQGEIPKAMAQRESGDLAGATKRLEKALEYIQNDTIRVDLEVQTRDESMTAEQDKERANRLISELGALEQQEVALNKLLEEFRGE